MDSLRPAGSVENGVVSTFDDQAGHGEVISSDGVSRSFHCVSIADGSRTIEVGVAVTFTVVPGHDGRWEATDLAPA